MVAIDESLNSGTSAGLALAGISLLRKSGARFPVHPAREIDALMEAVFGVEVDPDELAPGSSRLHGRSIVAVGTAAALPGRPIVWSGAAELPKRTVEPEMLVDQAARRGSSLR